VQRFEYLNFKCRFLIGDESQMTKASKIARELLSSVELFGFDTQDWAAGVVTGRKARSRSGGGGTGGNVGSLSEEQILKMLNQPNLPVKVADLSNQPKPTVEPGKNQNSNGTARS
jgi:hypothetical protein